MIPFEVSMMVISLNNAIERDSNVLSREWVFRGTRVPVSALFENLKDRASIDEFLDWFPGVQRDQVVATLDSRGIKYTEN